MWHYLYGLICLPFLFILSDIGPHRYRLLVQVQRDIVDWSAYW